MSDHTKSPGRTPPVRAKDMDEKIEYVLKKRKDALHRLAQ